MSKAHFLWVDDEIDLLKPHILFLEEKGYKTTCAKSGVDAIELCRSINFDIIFLDEHMPGLSGLETLVEIKQDLPDVPVIMITKSEDEGIMNQAIGVNIFDYLIKPVNPSQVLLSVKKILEKRRLVTETVSTSYSEEYLKLNSEIENCANVDDWKRLYKKIVRWELELEHTTSAMREMIGNQKDEANKSFSKFVNKNYKSWISNTNSQNDNESDNPILSRHIFEKHILPKIDVGEKVFFILIDNFRLDQWEAVKDIVFEDFDCTEDLYISILPTATPYSRNSVFSGLMPLQIAEMHPNLWVDEIEDDGKNEYEEQLIHSQLMRWGRNIPFSYYKINSNSEAEKLAGKLNELKKNTLNVMVFNFIDILSHAGTDSKMIRELASDDAAYRSLTRTWFQHSPLSRLLKKIAESEYRVILTSDHGSIRVKRGVKVIGDGETNSSLRYKLGRSLAYDPKSVFDIINPKNYGLPAPNMSTRYIFAQNRDFFLYPNNYNHFFNIFENSYQHGGVSMEEMMIPIIGLKPKMI